MKNISVIGAGTMGNGIAQTFALFNHKVVLYDINLESLKKANTTILNNLERMLKKGIVSDSEMKRTVENIHSTTDFESVINSDLVIEAVSDGLGEEYNA
jgi:3-hydroxybutyryl-CoA dehydrogenase